MVSWPDPGTRVTVRYRRPAGSVPPLTDAVGHLLEVDPVVRVRTKTGAVVEISPADVVALRVLTDAPIRTSQIRALEHAAAAARPGAERAWLDGWLLRAEPGARLAANSALPLDVSARLSALPQIVAWYRDRGLTPRLAIPDRLLSLPPGVAAERTERVLVRDVSSVTLEQRPRSSRRAAVTDSPDGARWVGVDAIRAPDDRAGVEALLAWGASRGATRAYVEVGDDDTDEITLAESLGFRLHHRRRYVTAPAIDTV
ncbi:GCN5 family acetyltransferase [Mycobacterium sp. 852002-51057_SCH5723018]|uniref:GNAT family N-acetyltransferase, cg3035/Rv0428c family n=1 Tax=Mycobacterium sp. 852002-51057_SCH5723018 TaxID=1834094 RepID=UPI0007FC8515|nr:GCN5 family acetyltransferase [Mycobacterium sp. 852002-51057_SCH5723018]OBG28898.1 GCN5 family acetyltransferase [Mycobacterium sp. 852002-51057_SCH5723018]